MAKSEQYKLLRRQLSHLRVYLLPKKFDPTGQYSQRNLSRAIAYRVLAHAEIEEYLEARVSGIAKNAVKNWKLTGQANNVLLALVAFSGKEMEEPPPSLEPSQPNQKSSWEERTQLSKKLESALNSYFRTVRNNHGVKEANLLRMLLPIGYPVEKLDPLWLASMNSFGERRGEAAHGSSIQHSVDPQSELTTVNNLLSEMEHVDVTLNSLE